MAILLFRVYDDTGKEVKRTDGKNGIPTAGSNSVRFDNYDGMMDVKEQTV